MIHILDLVKVFQYDVNIKWPVVSSAFVSSLDFLSS